MTVCAECGGEQRYTCHHEAGKMVYWFCEPDHKTKWLARRKRQQNRGAANGKRFSLIGATLLTFLLMLGV